MKRLEWVTERNNKSVDIIAKTAEFKSLESKLRTIYDSTDRIPYVYKQGDMYYNFWRDGDHPRGVWRRTDLESYQSDAPSWETILDLDALATEENENWVWHGANCLPPVENICMIALSRGGADADVKREFNVETKSFVEGGFFLPEAKSDVSWIDADHLIVGTDFGEGSLTESGYPMVSKIWTRGTDLSEKKPCSQENPPIFQQVPITTTLRNLNTPSFIRHDISTNRMYLQTKKGLVQLDKQDSANPSIWKRTVLLNFEKTGQWMVRPTSLVSC